MTDDGERWLVFEAGTRVYRVPASVVRSIEPFACGEPLPYPTAIDGVLPYRGELVAVLKGVLSTDDSGGGRTETPERLVVLSSSQGLLGLGVSHVRGLESVPDCEQAEPISVEQLAEICGAGRQLLVSL